MLLNDIKGILISDLTNREKLNRMYALVEKVESIEMKAIELASKEGRKPTIFDRLKALDEMPKRAGVDFKKLQIHLENGIQWLIDIIRKNGNWETGAGFKPFVLKDKPTEDERPLSMLFVAPWEISITILTLQDWKKSFPDNDNISEVQDLIEKGRAYLRKIQQYFGNGSVGDSIWCKGMSSGRRRLQGNTMETCMAISVWGSGDMSSEDKDAIAQARKYILNNWNKEDGGWGFKKGWKADLKSTGLSIMIPKMVKPYYKASAAEEKKYQAYCRKGLKWMLKRQEEDGSWLYQYRSSRDSGISGTFYAIETLIMEKLYRRLHQSQKESQKPGHLAENIEVALNKALRWYETSQELIVDGDKEGWGWKNHTDSSAVENTAAGLIILLDTGWVNERTPELERSLKFLLSQRHAKNFWYVYTPIVLRALLRILKSETRIYKKMAPKGEDFWSS